MDNVVADLDSLVVLAGAEHPGLPVFLLGHSMGGAIAVCYAMRHQPDDTRAAQSSEAGGRAGREHVRLTGLLLSGPLAALEAASPVQRVVANALSALAPRLPLIKIDASLVSRDPDVVDAYVNDPLVYRGRLRARTIGELSDAIGRFPEGVRAIRIPTLIMYGTADGLCPPAGSVMLSERIGADDKTLKAYDGLAHEIFNEPERQQVIDDMCAWLAAHVPIAPGLSSAAGG
jgi:alpha-beta hydrolase superfamily lysophospholipase